MKTLIHIYIYAGKGWPKVQELFNKMGRYDLAEKPQERPPYGYNFTFEEIDPTLKIMKEDLQKIGPVDFDWWISSSDKASDIPEDYFEVEIFFCGRFKSKNIEIIKNIFKKIELDTPKLTDGMISYKVVLHRKDSKLNKILAELTKIGPERFNWNYKTERIYTDNELAQFTLLRMIVRTGRGEGGPTYGTQYDLSEACPKCGTGAKQISPLVVKAGEVPYRKDIFGNYDDDFLISPRLKERLKKSDLTGFEIRHVKTLGKTRGKFDYSQLLFTNQLPPFAESSKIARSNPCPKCNRDGYFEFSIYEPTEIHYKSERFSKIKLLDFNNTYECFGNSGINKDDFSKSHFAQPLILVTPNVLNIFRELKITQVDFEPVFIDL